MRVATPRQRGSPESKPVGRDRVFRSLRACCILEAVPPLILVVDDEPVVRRVTCHYLVSAGFGCVSAGSAAEAMAAVGTGNEPDLLLLDVRLPDLSGPELALDLHQCYPNASVLFVSGWVDGMLSEKLEALRWEFLPKPFTSAELVSVVHRMLSTHSDA